MSGKTESESHALRARRAEGTEASTVIVQAGSDRPLESRIIQRREGRRHCDEGGRQGNARVARLLVYAGGKCEPRALGGGMALATGGLAVGGSRGG